MPGMDTEPRQRKLVPLLTMARRLGVTQKWLRVEADAGRLPALKAGARLLFVPEAVEAELLKRATATAPTKGGSDGK